jgi:hypothetical protein
MPGCWLYYWSLARLHYHMLHYTRTLCLVIGFERRFGIQVQGRRFAPNY